MYCLRTVRYIEGCSPATGMSRSTSILLLFVAALLEAGGDAIIRVALHSSAFWMRVALFAVSAGVLLAYGLTVNTPPWDFGQVLGLYVVFFFVIAQAISWVGFGQRPSTALLIGGALIVSGGLVIALAKV
jgi:drug/metabolite transporter (DMT)-like permease